MNGTPFATNLGARKNVLGDRTAGARLEDSERAKNGPKQNVTAVFTHTRERRFSRSKLVFGFLSPVFYGMYCR
jgi:hypothetical protein